jgi:hypothetical protein
LKLAYGSDLPKAKPHLLLQGDFMKKTKIIVSVAAALAITATSALSVAAFDTNDIFDMDADFSIQKPASKITMNKNKVVKASGKQFKLNADTGLEDENVNYYSSDTRVAQVSSNGTVRLRKKGTAKIIAECNGAKTFCDVTVKKPKARPAESSGSIAQLSLNSKTMAKADAKIGHQTQHAYPDSTIMCSAYSFAYAYYQVTGKVKPAGYFWSSGGCTWIGGTYHRYSSSSQMLAAIKSQLDSGKACVGYLSTGSSPTHYVTFFGYTGSGANLSDYKILDPWDGKITTAAGYGYSSIGYHVATVN